MKQTLSNGTVLECTPQELFDYTKIRDEKELRVASASKPVSGGLSKWKIPAPIMREKAKPTFKVGDKVKVIGNNSQDIHHLRDSGTVGTVRKHRTAYSGRAVREAYMVDFPSKAGQVIAVEDLEAVPFPSRIEVVKEAREIVRNIDTRGKSMFKIGGDEGNETYRNKYYRVSFVVDRKKRTVVALVRKATFSGRITSTNPDHKGISKANPDDVFNVYIGMAIAALRAFDLDVPEKFTNAPKPLGVKVGDITQLMAGPIRSIAKVERIEDGVNYYRTNGLWSMREDLRVLDDTDRLDYKGI